MKANYFWLGLGLTPLLLGQLGSYSCIADGFSHFRIYYLLYFFLLFLIALFRKNRFLAVSSFVLTVILLISISSFYLPTDQPKHSGETLRIGAINLWSSNRDFRTVKDYIKQSDFDVIIFQEYTPRWDEQLQVLRHKYPQIKRVPRLGNFGIAIYSRVPTKSIEVQNFSYFKIPTVFAKLDWEGKPITIIGTHPVPPINNLHFKARNNQFKSLNQVVKKAAKKAEVVLIGDLNCTSFSPNFDLLTDGTMLIDTRKGRGLHDSWNADISLIKVAIDHALVTDNLIVVDRKLGRNIGSDHFPLELEISFK